jgi:hypothetical protein
MHILSRIPPLFSAPARFSYDFEALSSSRSSLLSTEFEKIKRPLRPVLTQSVLWNSLQFLGFSECQSTIAAANNTVFALGS